MKRYKLRDTFNLPDVPEAAEIPGFEPGLPGVPKVDPHYVFEHDRLRQFVMFWVGGFQSLMIEGDPSAGKTSFIEQIHARLNVPCFKVACGEGLEARELLGELKPTEQGLLKWFDGPVLMAYRTGGSLLLDEWNGIEPGQALRLNPYLEGYELMVPATGEIVCPLATTRFFVTQNPVDSKAMVAGRYSHDVASDDRFSYMEVDYLRADLERDLVVRHLTAGKVPVDAAKNIAQICVEVANRIRVAYRTGSDDIEKPLSTRVVLRWAKYTVLYSEVMKRLRRSGVHYAVRQSVRMPESMARAVNELITMVAGFDENLVSRSS